MTGTTSGNSLVVFCLGDRWLETASCFAAEEARQAGHMAGADTCLCQGGRQFEPPRQSLNSRCRLGRAWSRSPLPADRTVIPIKLTFGPVVGAPMNVGVESGIRSRPWCANTEAGRLRPRCQPLLHEVGRDRSHHRTLAHVLSRLAVAVHRQRSRPHRRLVQPAPPALGTGLPVTGALRSQASVRRRQPTVKRRTRVDHRRRLRGGRHAAGGQPCTCAHRASEPGLSLKPIPVRGSGVNPELPHAPGAICELGGCLSVV